MQYNIIPGTSEGFIDTELGPFSLDAWRPIELDTSYAFLISDVVLKDGATTLVLNTDYELKEDVTATSQESGYTSKTLYGRIRITNVAYTGITLQITGANFGTYVNNQARIDSITNNRNAYTIGDASNVVHDLPDATTSYAEVIIKRKGAGTGKVTFTTVDSQTIEGLVVSTWELEGEGIIILYPDGGNWEVKEYRDYLSLDSGSQLVWKEKDGTERQEITRTVNTTINSTQGAIYSSGAITGISRQHNYLSIKFEEVEVYPIVNNFVWASRHTVVATVSTTSTFALMDGVTSGSNTDYVVEYSSIGRWRT